MNSLRSRTRLSDSPNVISNPALEANVFKDHKRRARSISWRGVGVAMSMVVLLFVVFLQISSPVAEDRLRLRQDATLHQRRHLEGLGVSVERPLPHKTPSAPSPVPVVYRGFLDYLSEKRENPTSSCPQLVMRIPTTSPKYILVGTIGEQESKARMHFLDILELARRLGRILVLPNVGKSRLGMCRDYSFDKYYDMRGLDGVMTMDDFLAVARDEDRLNAQLVACSTNPKDLLPPECLSDEFDLLPLPIHVDKKNVVDRLRILIEVDVLIFNWNQRHPIFSNTTQLLYAPALVNIADALIPRDAYVMVHWRMETVPASTLVSCAYALLDAIHATGLATVWLATDYPFPLRGDKILIRKSSTFRDFGSEHVRAIDVLMGDPDLNIWDLERALGTMDVDTGVLGILDKLAGFRAEIFISGSEGCGRKSSFTKQIVTARRDAQRTKRGMSHVVDYFGLEHN